MRADRRTDGTRATRYCIDEIRQVPSGAFTKSIVEAFCEPLTRLWTTAWAVFPFTVTLFTLVVKSSTLLSWLPSAVSQLPWSAAALAAICFASSAEKSWLQILLVLLL